MRLGLPGSGRHTLHVKVRFVSVLVVPDSKPLASQLVSSKDLMGLDEFWCVCMSAAIADALCFAAAWFWIAQEGRPHLCGLLLAFSFWFCAGLRRWPLHISGKGKSFSKGTERLRRKERFSSGTLHPGRVLFPQVRFRVLFGECEVEIFCSKQQLRLSSPSLWWVWVSRLCQQLRLLVSALL